MSGKIIKLPVGSIKRKRINANAGILECEVSGRWLQFPEASDKLQNIEYLCLDVMTHGSTGKDRKICELILDKKQLVKMLSELPVNDKSET
ncbi:MAG: hypothetical protein J7L34_06240 [Thermotogaceae bacterium]|nr:hypothetical protein [Thermotogaceae bacterium]